MDSIYLDYAASTPVDQRVLEAMSPYFSGKFGNPGSLHSFGQEAIAAVDESRETIAKAIGAEFREIIFTGSATEANNLVLRGIIKQLRITNSELEKTNPQSAIRNPRIMVSTIEHESVLETARDLERDGVEVICLPVDRSGVVDLKKLEASLNDRTVLISVMYANNEIGTIQPIKEIAKIIFDFKAGKTFSFGAALRPSGHGARRASEGAAPARVLAGDSSGSRKEKISQAFPLFHTDASQAFQFLDCDVNKLGVDLMTLSAHKIYGPKGIGSLYVRQLAIGNSRLARRPSARSQLLDAIITGGGQEFGLRSGTENVPSIVGFAKAVEIASGVRSQESSGLEKLRDYFWGGLKKIFPEAEVNGEPMAYGDTQYAISTLPNILNVYFPGKSAEELLTKFDLVGLAVSSGSACRSRAMESSYVIEALGFDRKRAKSSIRFSFGRPTTKEEIDKALEIIKMSVK